ncbi:MAG TPA: hypothetical protein VH478_01170 [Trebonia sp.]|nr:hypothetical protein [Trebonia sp.]
MSALTKANARETPAIAPVMKMAAPSPKYFGRSVGHSARILRLAPDSQIKISPTPDLYIVAGTWRHAVSRPITTIFSNYP